MTYRSEVYTLKQELRWHVNNGCKVRDPNNGGVIANPEEDSRLVDNQDSPDSTTANSKYIDTTQVAPSAGSNSTASSRMPPNKAYLSDCKQQEQQTAHKS